MKEIPQPLVDASRRFVMWTFICLLAGGPLATCSTAQEVSRGFVVKLSSNVTNKAITGRVLVFVTTNAQAVPMRGPNWFKPEPFAAVEVTDLAPGGTVLLDDQVDCFPQPISSWPDQNYRIQAVLDQDFYYPDAANGPGNIHSQVIRWNPSQQPRIELELNQVIPEFEYRDTQRLKFVQRKSELLSQHFGHEVIDRVAVILPRSYEEQPDRRYPVYYEVTGFGGNLRSMSGRGPGAQSGRTDPLEYIHVMLTGECKYGHHVYANSQANGPRGDALIQEMIPYIDANFRTIADGRARFVGGHSSGGWSSLWLQVTYPEMFAAVFSTSPDPVDFRDFQGTNLYADPPESVYVDPQGNRRPLARQGDQVLLMYDDFCKMDQVMGKGGQMRSFDAVFSPLASDGTPLRCWNKETGLVMPEVVQHWKKYDISLLLEQNWSTLSKPLAGKIHVWMGDQDTFYLEGATRLLAERLQSLGSDAKIQFIPGASHNLPATVQQQIRALRAEIFDRNFNKDGTEK